MTTPDLTALDNTLPEIRVTEILDRIVELERRQAACEAEGEPFADDDAAELMELVELEGRLPRGTKRIVRFGSAELTTRARLDVLTLVTFAGVTYWALPA